MSGFIFTKDFSGDKDKDSTAYLYVCDNETGNFCEFSNVPRTENC